MITFKTGDIFTEEVEALVNTVNCVGIMGRGIALQFKKRYPENFHAYAVACKHEQVLPGKMFLYKTGTLTDPKYIINFPTKRHWRGKSRIEDIENGLEDLIRIIQEKRIASVALPPLGSGLGGLDWPEVKQRIVKSFKPLQNILVVVFEPGRTPVAEKMVTNRAVPRITPGRAALIELVHRYLGGLLDPLITLLEVHKLMYFLQESGEKLRLRYSEGLYGPYAENLRHVLNAIEGHYISGYADGGDTPEKQLKLVPGAFQEASRFLMDHQITKHHFDRVSDLVDGFESPFGLELLSTVHWIARDRSIRSTQQVIDQTYRWNERKKQFSPRQIELALNVLIQKEWINRYGWTAQGGG